LRKNLLLGCHVRTKVLLGTLKLIAAIDEFKGRWKAIETLAPEKLTSLRRIATIQSAASSTRIEGAKLSDRDVEKLLSGVKAKSFASRDELEVASKRMPWT
jgi:hypothetical protein